MIKKVVIVIIVMTFSFLNLIFALPELNITGIIEEKGEKFAIVNGKIVGEGFELEQGLKIKEIGKDPKTGQGYVKFEYKDEIIIKYTGNPNAAQKHRISTDMQESKDKEAVILTDHRKINDIYVHLSKRFGEVSGYIIFLNKDGTQCATTGNISLSKKWIERVVERKSTLGRSYDGLKTYNVVHKKERLKHIKTILIKPENFAELEIRSGDVVYGIPIKLEASKCAIKNKDKIAVEWYAFKKEVEIYEF